MGATGRTGKLVLEKLVNNHHEVVALVRNQSSFSTTDQVLAYQGSPLAFDAVSKAINGCDAVVNCLNLGRTSEDPFAPLTAPVNFISSAVANVLNVMEERKIKRIVSMSAWGVGESWQYLPSSFRDMIKGSNIEVAFKDHLAQENLLKSSDKDWTVIRPVGLVDKLGSGRLIVTSNDSSMPNPTISRDLVADTIVMAIEQGRYLREVVIISEE